MSSSTRWYPPEDLVEVLASVLACNRVGGRYAWVKEGSYSSQIRAPARFEAITVIDTRPQVPGAGRMRVKSVGPLFPLQSKKTQHKSKKAQECAKIIATLYPTTLVTEPLPQR